MILVYSLLEENRERLVNLLISEIRSQDRLYHRISRVELKDSVQAMFNAYLDFLVSRNKTKLSVALTYIVRSRLSQSFTLNAILKAALSLLPVLRLFLQETVRSMPDQEVDSYNRAMTYIEGPIFDLAGMLIEIFEEQQRHSPRKSLDLSKMMIYRA